MTGRSTFDTVRIVGGLLPPGLLERVGKQDASLEAIAPSDYYLAPGERLGEAITRSWNRLRTLWERFSERIDETVPMTGPTRQDWLLPLFQELGFGNLAAAPAFELLGKSYPISHLSQSTPIHLVGVGVELDRRTPGVAGAALASPHGLMQEFLNRSDDFLWGIVSNGRQLRILRDNSSLTRIAYVEFDLREMFDGEVFSDFTLLWLVGHASRLEGPSGKQVLERWREDAARQGVRALDALRDGVETAIVALGTALVGHPANGELRRRLVERTLDAQELYRQILRVVYRLLFLLVAEGRGLLLDPKADPTARLRYQRYYSISRLRDVSETTRGSPHTDLWNQLGLIARALEFKGEPALGLLPLGGFLWSDEATNALNDSHLPNEAVLSAIRGLTTVRPTGELMQRVDYNNLGAEELGSIYESLLEYVPQVNLVAGTFELVGAAGNERKTTGSYYTPTSLIEELLNSALDPVLEEAASKPDPERAVLDLKVVDPAAGSGHFLIAAAHRIANRLARLRAGGDEPSPNHLRTALRDVVAHCLYAVDINPMAVELAKVALWIEAMEPGKPLTFLDHHIVCGNSLLGVTPKLLEGGIPDEAFVALTGDEKERVKALRRRNREEQKKSLVAFTFGDSSAEMLRRAADEIAAIDALSDVIIEEIAEKHARFAKYLEGDKRRSVGLAADTWVAAFVGPKTKGSPEVTSSVLNAVIQDPTSIDPGLVAYIEELASDLRFHHWHVAFPDVFVAYGGEEDDETGWTGGFDVVLGNPPWERVKLQEKEFFATSAPEISLAPNKAARERALRVLKEENPDLWRRFQKAVHDAEAVGHFLRASGVFPLCGRGDVNTYAVFAETMRSIIGSTGKAGVIVPTGIATDDTTKHFFADLVNQKSLASLFDFENRNGIFPGVHRSQKFCLLTLSGLSDPVAEAEFFFFALQTNDLADSDRRFTLSPDDFALLNPTSKTCPIFRSRRDADLNRQIYRRNPVISGGTRPGRWPHLTIATLFHMTNDAHLFRSGQELASAGFTKHRSFYLMASKAWLPTYEGKMVTSFDHRDASIVIKKKNPSRQQQADPATLNQKGDPNFTVKPAVWGPATEVARRAEVPDPLRAWWVGAKRVTASTNWRTLVACVVPPSALSYTLYRVTAGDPEQDCLVLAGLQSFAFDYLVRQKTSQSSLPIGVIRETAFPALTRLCEGFDEHSIVQRVLELSYTAWDLEPLAADLGFHGPPFRFELPRRQLVRSELDAAFFLLYGIAREDVDHIMETFPIVKRKDIVEHGSFHTKELILDAYDRMANAIETGEPYQTILDPPPADPSLGHPVGVEA